MYLWPRAAGCKTPCAMYVLYPKSDHPPCVSFAFSPSWRLPCAASRQKRPTWSAVSQSGMAMQMGGAFAPDSPLFLRLIEDIAQLAPHNKALGIRFVSIADGRVTL